MRLKDKVAIITGAGSGIGRGACLRFAEEGAAVVAVDIVPQRVEETVALVTEAEGRAVPVVADVSKSDDVQRLFAEALSAFGSYDILINNAGILTWAPLWELEEDDWDRVMAVNVKSMFLCIKEAARYWMREKRPGKIVNTASISSEYANLGNAHYSASKGAVTMLSRAAALELAPYKINVNCVGPGGVMTNISPKLQDPATAAEGAKLVPLGRNGEPRDIANMMLFLASDDADWITGQMYLVDGGRMIGIPT